LNVGHAQATLDLVEHTLIISIAMLTWSELAFRAERGRFARTALVIGSLVLQTSCIGMILLNERKTGPSTVLLVVAAAAVIGLAIVSVRRDPLWSRFRK
jgi:hypothetical protein